MKKLSLLVVLTFAFVSLSFGQIGGSAHDFSGAAWNTGGEICQPCHTPHNAIDISGAPLWNHASTSATFTVYTSGTMNATPGQPLGTSKMCLSCHDGTVALDSFNGETGTNFISGTGSLGTDLSNDHPISFAYTTTLASTDGELYDPSTANSGLGSTIAADMLFGDQMECASCHDVHNSTNHDFLLLKANGGSALCLTCHDK